MKTKDALFKEAQRIQQYAYAPYSQFKVGVCVQSAQGVQSCGCNVENASYGLTLCAEAVAISHLISLGEQTLRDMVIVADRDLCPPCGACCQRIAEFADGQTQIHLANSTGIQRSLGLDELLPLRFTL